VAEPDASEGFAARLAAAFGDHHCGASASSVMTSAPASSYETTSQNVPYLSLSRGEVDEASIGAEIIGLDHAPPTTADVRTSPGLRLPGSDRVAADAAQPSQPGRGPCDPTT
jgi:hypothetical protein